MTSFMQCENIFRDSGCGRVRSRCCGRAARWVPGRDQSNATNVNKASFFYQIKDYIYVTIFTMSAQLEVPYTPIKHDVLLNVMQQQQILQQHLLYLHLLQNPVHMQPLFMPWHMTTEPSLRLQPP